MHKAWLQSIPGVLLLAAMIGKLRDAFRFEVPVGYQDENGYHEGKTPAKPQSWPEFW
ncbi:MAG TPA: hypothetical protein VN281_12980 [Verrucomicrobiae bacterium]|jgi:hypothetical protein|nr:hypothetical protein [Verrucomicrobiae bacterium]